MYGGVGASSGLLLGGWLYQHWGPIEMFELQAAGIGGTCVVYFAAAALPHALRSRRRQRRGSGAVVERMLRDSASSELGSE